LDPERLFEAFFELAKPLNDDEQPCILQQFPDKYDDQVRLTVQISAKYATFMT